MNIKSFHWAGIFLIFSAITFWLSWFLMPDQGTADTQHILTIVKENRDSVYLSVIIQIISSVVYIPALFLLAKSLPLKNNTLIGIILLAIGAMGMCMDAFFHLLAFFMTDNSINLQADIINLMAFMQTKAIMFLIPLLLAFFIGSLVLSVGLYKQQIISRIPMLTFISAFAIGVLGAIIVNKILGYGRPTLVLSVLALFAIGQILIGHKLMKYKESE